KPYEQKNALLLVDFCRLYCHLGRCHLSTGESDETGSGGDPGAGAGSCYILHTKETPAARQEGRLRETQDTALAIRSWFIARRHFSSELYMACQCATLI